MIVKAKHIYETPEIYDLMYNRNKSYKLGEATIYAEILQSYKRPLSHVLELLSGENSSHKNYFLDVINDDVEYYCMDNIAKGDNTVTVSNPSVDPFGKSFDAILAFYYTASSYVDFDNGGRITRENCIKLYTNVYKHLKPNGIFLLDSAIDGYNLALSNPNDDMSGEKEIDTLLVDNSNLLLRVLREKGIKIDKYEALFAKVIRRSYYERLTGNNVDYISKVKIYRKDKKELLATYTFELPFCQRYFSEPEIVDMLKEAGFKTIKFWSCDYPNHAFDKLGKFVKYGENSDEDDADAMMPNVFACIREK